LGVKKSNIAIADIGDTVELTEKTIRFGEKFTAGSRFVDGVGIDGADSFVLRDRIHLSEDGLLVVVVGIDKFSGQLSDMEIIGKGLVLGQTLIDDAKNTVIHALDKIDMRKIRDENELSGLIRRSLKNFVFKATKKNPMILPVVMVI
jgi:ribonuclease J